MREILFRGKQADTWFYGTPVEKCEYVEIYNFNLDSFEIEHHVVIPETVGQFTGMIDKNGQKIYEGDVIIYDNTYKNRVFWSENERAFYIEGINHCDLDRLGNLYGSLCKVIGNIYDNPELLED